MSFKFISSWISANRILICEGLVDRKHWLFHIIFLNIGIISIRLRQGRCTVSSVYCRVASLFLSVKRCVSYTYFQCVASLCSWAVYKKTRPEVLPWSCMLHSTTERQVKCHVWEICSSCFLFVKAAGAGAGSSLLRGCTPALMAQFVFGKTAHLCCWSVPNTAVKHRCLGWVISVFLYTCNCNPISAVSPEAAVAHHPGGHHTVEREAAWSAGRQNRLRRSAWCSTCH